MSILYLGTDSETLAEKLASDLDEAAPRDFFAPVTIVTPNRYVAKWLRLWLARRLGVAINLRFLYLENALWEMLREIDARQHPAPPELLDHESYRLMVLAVLAEEGAELAPFHGYVRQGQASGRNFWRRSWHLADRLARFIRDYEYHRQDALIQHWLRNELGYPRAGDAGMRLERSQREVFQRITRLPDGKRALLEKATGKVLKTLPQYAMEVMELGGAPQTGERRRVHLFGVTQISALHIKTLHWLGEYFDLRLYHLNPLIGSAAERPTKESLQTLAQRYRDFSRTGETTWEPGQELWAAWGQAGADSLWLMAELLGPAFKVELARRARFQRAPDLHEPSPPTTTVLHRLQDHLCGSNPSASSRLPQDTSLQIVACPGIYREVESVYNSILDNLQHDPGLKQTDIAVLVTDLAHYRPVLQAVFERQPRRLLYNLANFSAAGLSSYGQALLDFLDLALESFSRSRVFAVLLNPCVLARLGVDRTQALNWLSWAEQLGIYHGWNQLDKQERGYQGSPLYSWRLGLQRLRLGRIMEAAPEQSDGPAPRFHDVVPYADLASGDKEQLDAFCRAVEGLLPCLVGLRRFQGTGAQWAGEIRKLAQHFLTVPDDRPEEAQVRDQLLQSLGQLVRLDQLRSSDVPGSLSLALVREFVHDNLEALEGTKGEFLTGGITIAPMQSLRPVPFRIIYVIGLGEDLFPGPNALPTFDLRAHERLPGDIRPAENNRFLFLDTLLAARAKIYLLYNSRELQRDQELHPCVPLSQLRRYLEDHVIEGSFAITQVPLTGCDSRYVETKKSSSDILVNYNEAEHLLALADARRTGRVRLDARGSEEIERRLHDRCRDFPAADAPPSGALRESTAAVTVPLHELTRFLLCPAEAALRRHLHLDDDDEIEGGDEEPFWTNALQEYHLVVHTLERFVTRAMAESVTAAEADWRRRFDEYYDDCRLRCKVPEGAFADVDRASLSQTLEQRISAAGGLADFLRSRQDGTFAGPILLGESLTPVHARRRFPALELQLGQSLFAAAQARLVGSLRFAWRSQRSFDVLVLTNRNGDSVPDKQLSKPLLEPLLFCLALRAGSDEGDGVASGAWTENMPMRIHVSHADGMTRFTYRPKDWPAGKARDYLTRLVADLLDPTRFELLPFELIVRDKELREGYVSDKPASLQARDYWRKLNDCIEQDRDNEGYFVYRGMDLLDIIDPKVPDDALAKVRRRYRLLDRGPANNRRLPSLPVRKGKGTAGRSSAHPP